MEGEGGGGGGGGEVGRGREKWRRRRIRAEGGQSSGAGPPAEAALPPAQPPATQIMASTLSSPKRAPAFSPSCEKGRGGEGWRVGLLAPPTATPTSRPCSVQLSVFCRTTLAAASSLANRSIEATHWEGGREGEGGSQGRGREGSETTAAPEGHGAAVSHPAFALEVGHDHRSECSLAAVH